VQRAWYIDAMLQRGHHIREDVTLRIRLSGHRHRTACIGVVRGARVGNR